MLQGVSKQGYATGCLKAGICFRVSQSRDMLQGVSKKDMLQGVSKQDMLQGVLKQDMLYGVSKHGYATGCLKAGVCYRVSQSRIGYMVF